MKKTDSTPKKKFIKGLEIRSRKTLLISGAFCIAALIITTSAIAAINNKGNVKNAAESSSVSNRICFQASFSMADWKACLTETGTSTTPNPTETPTEAPTPEDDIEAIKEAIKSEEAQIKPNSGSVLNSSEYKYDAAEDPENKKDQSNNGNSSSNTITNVTTKPTVAVTPTTKPTATATPSPSPTVEATPEATPSTGTSPEPSKPTATPSPSPSPTQPVYIDGWNTISGGSYYYMNGGFVTGWADLGLFRYYFDQTGLKKSRVGIDVSSYQGSIDWNAVKKSGVDFAIIRAGYRGYSSGQLYADPYFEKNVKGALAAGIECGAYIYSAAITEVEGAQEANFLLNAISGYNITGPLIIDVECTNKSTDRTTSLTKDQRTNVSIAALEAIKLSGKKAMLYTGYYFYYDNLNASRLKNYPLWIAFYTSNYSKVGNTPYSIWQYSSTGRVPGISGNVDLNIWK